MALLADVPACREIIGSLQDRLRCCTTGHGKDSCIGKVRCINKSNGETLKHCALQVLRLVLYDYDALDKDDEIGEAKIAVKDLKNQEEKDVWLDVKEMAPHHDGSHDVRKRMSNE